jgi:DNA-binding Lrp family transcriptional regulator
MSEPNPEGQLWDLMRGALATRALAIAADLRVPDALAGGPRPVAEVAREVGADPDTLHRVLRALASDGVFAEEEPGVFRNTPASELLGRDGWDDLAHFHGGIWHRAAGELQPSGEVTFPQAFGTDFWSWLAAHPTERLAFDRAMVQGVEQRIERLTSLDWHGDETVVDVGGGNGSLLAALLSRKPGLQGIVFDLPETDHDEASLGERCTFVAGSFFESVPLGDVYVLSTVLHNWDDERAAIILRMIHAAGSFDTRLVILDAVVPAGNEPHGAKWSNLMVLALFGARERSEAQWRALLDDTSFEPVRIDERLIEARWR